MRYFSISFLLIWLLPLGAFAQRKQGQARIDSLMATLHGRADDTLQVRALNFISSTYRPINLDSSLVYGRRGLAMARKIGYKRGEAVANNRIGDALTNAYKWAEGLPYYLEGARIYQTMGNQLGMAMSYTNASEVYTFTKQGKQAYEYASLGLNKLLKYGGSRELLVFGYVDLGAAASLLGRKKEATRYLLKADSIARLEGSPVDMATTAFFLAKHYQENKEYSPAIAALFRCQKIGRANGMTQYDGLLVARIGIAYKEIADQPVLPKPDSLIPATRAAIREKALAYIQEGIRNSLKAKTPPSEMRDLYKNYGELLAVKGRYEEAAKAFSSANDLGDTVAKAADGERIARFESERAMEIKDKDLQIASLEVSKKQNVQWFFIAGLWLLAGIVGLMFRGNRLIKKEKKRSDDLLLNILPSEVAEELKDTGGAQARHFDQVSVLFTDFVNFTEIAEQLSPEALVQELHACFSAFDQIIEKHGMEKIKTIGDAYLAVSGLPVANPKHACACVEAGLEIREYIKKRKAGGGPFDIRIGIHSGPVVAGIVGVKKFAYDIWGDTVNTAARMEQHGEAGHVNISRTTRDLVYEDFTCQERGKVAAKNKGNLEMYFISKKTTDRLAL